MVTTQEFFRIAIKNTEEYQRNSCEPYFFNSQKKLYNNCAAILQ